MLIVDVLIIASLAIGLICLIDLWNQKCSVWRRVLWSPVPFIPLLGPMMYYALFEPPPVWAEPPVSQNPIERWKEWLKNRYNPGYFTGGRIHPTYRASGLSVGIMFILSGIMPLVLVALSVFTGIEEGEAGVLAFELGIGLVMIVAGLVKMGERKKKGKDK